MTHALISALYPASENPVSLGLPANWQYDATLIPILPPDLDYRFYKRLTAAPDRYALRVAGDVHVWNLQTKRRLVATPDKGDKNRNATGRLRVTLDLGRFVGKKKPYLNRLVCEAVYGPPPTSDQEAHHSDGVVTNNCFSNLHWRTGEENRRIERIRSNPNRPRRASPQKKGSDNSRSKIPNLLEFLEDSQGARNIFNGRYAKALSVKELSCKYGISEHQVRKILTGVSRREEVEALCKDWKNHIHLPSGFRKEAPKRP